MKRFDILAEFTTVAAPRQAPRMPPDPASCAIRCWWRAVAGPALGVLLLAAF